MKTRILTALTMLVLVVVAMLSRIWTLFILDIVLGLLAVVGTVEVARVFERSKRYCSINTVGLYPAVMYLAMSICITLSLDLVWIVLTMIFSLVVVATIEYIVSLCSKKSIKKEMEKYKVEEMSRPRYCIEKALNTAMVMIYPTLLFGLLFLLNHLNEISIVSNVAVLKSGMIDWFLLVMILVVSSATDTCAYFVGVTFKGAKLCPTISPKKTISGAVGGLIGGILFGVATFLIFNTFPCFQDAMSYLNINIWYAVFIGFMGSVFDQMGDIVASMLKRKARVKDYGTLFPGHGGVMDRVDGLLFVTLFVSVFGVILL